MSRVSAAYHEAGHAFVAVLLGFKVISVAVEENGTGSTTLDLGGKDEAAPGSERPPLDAVAVIETIRSNGNMTERLVAEVRRTLGSDQRLTDYLAMSFAGRVAQRRVVGEHVEARGAVGDRETEGLVVGAITDSSRIPLYGQARGMAESFVSGYWDQINVLALALITRGRLTGNEVLGVLEQEASRHGAVERFGLSCGDRPRL